jgi:O-antigen/teichoic acid export membrane protein
VRSDVSNVPTLKDGLARFPRLWRNKSLRVFVVRGLGVVALLGFEVVMARSLGVTGYGVFNVLLALATIAARLAPMGWLNAGTKFVSSYANAGQVGHLNGVLIQSHVTLGFGLATILLIYAVGAHVWPGLGGGIDIIYLVPLTASIALLDLHRYLLRGFHAGDLGEALPMFFLPLLVTAAVFLAHVHDPRFAAILYAGASVPLLVISTVAVWQKMPKGWLHAAPRFEMQAWAVAAAAMMVGSLSDELATRLPVIILGLQASPQEAGLYQAGARLALMTVFVLRVLTPVAAPTISVLHSGRRYEELRAAYGRWCLIAGLGALPFLLVFWFASGPILGWFGAGFAQSGPILKVLSVGYFASALAGPCATGLMMIGKERVYGIMAIGNLLMTAIITLVLSKSYGAMGAAMATSAMQVLANLAYLIVFWRALRAAPHVVPVNALQQTS